MLQLDSLSSLWLAEWLRAICDPLVFGHGADGHAEISVVGVGLDAPDATLDGVEWALVGNV